MPSLIIEALCFPQVFPKATVKMIKRWPKPKPDAKAETLITEFPTSQPHMYAIVLGGTWVDIGRVISRVTIVITHARGPITPLRITMDLQNLTDCARSPPWLRAAQNPQLETPNPKLRVHCGGVEEAMGLGFRVCLG